jgi:tetratricopeptide (TPR) repeat protein
MRRIALALFIGLATAGFATVAPIATSPAHAASALDCFSKDMELRINGCTELLKSPLGPDEKAQAYASRALGLSIKGWYAEAIKDYDRSLELVPNSAVPLNNRAWAYFRWGKPAEGRDDVEKSITLDPTSGPSFDTRAHIAQALGDPKSALVDYKRAMTFGGTAMTKMYQCGLTEHGLYKGPLDGIQNQELNDALAQCVEDVACDPLPADEECRFGVS